MHPAAPLDARVLRRWPLPALAQEADKEDRGRVLIVAGSRETPGAALLAGTAALRAGAGKLVLATAQSVAGALAIALPEARVIALPETPGGALAPEALHLLKDAGAGAAATLVGPGFMDEAGTLDFVDGLLPLLSHSPVVLDALAMHVLMRRSRFEQPLLLSPHAGEMARLRGCSKEAVEAQPHAMALQCAQAWNVGVALKGGTTFIALPDGRQWRYEGDQPGLATSGSGDVLAGLLAGLAARGAPLEQAAAWAVVLHALAGARVARRLGPLGYLAREIADEIPGLLRTLRPRGFRRPGPAPRE